MTKRSRRQGSGLQVSLSGSFRMLDEIITVARRLEKQGIAVRSPKTAGTDRIHGDFVYLKGDRGSPAQIEKKHPEAMMSDLLYVINPTGAIGPSVSLEIGFAMANNIPVYCSHQPSDTLYRSLFSVIPTSKIAKLAKSFEGTTKTQVRTINELQKLVRKIGQAKGFESETTLRAGGWIKRDDSENG